MTARRENGNSIFEGILEFIFDVVLEFAWQLFSEFVCRAFALVARWVYELIDF